jgi:hypothetical protein
LEIDPPTTRALPFPFPFLEAVGDAGVGEVEEAVPPSLGTETAVEWEDQKESYVRAGLEGGAAFTARRGWFVVSLEGEEEPCCCAAEEETMPSVLDRGVDTFSHGLIRFGRGFTGRKKRPEGGTIGWEDPAICWSFCGVDGTLRLEGSKVSSSVVGIWYKAEDPSLKDKDELGSSDWA